MRRPLARAWRAAAAAGLLVLVTLLGAAPSALGQGPFAPFMTPEQEVEVGRQEHPKVVAEFGGVYDDPELGGYVAMIGGALVANSEQPRYAFTFTILNSPVINAFALPGGYVYVTRGLMALANSEAELAGVLAHEIGHVTARHPAQRYSRGVIANLGVTLLGILTDNPQVNQVAQIGGGLYLMRFSREEEYESDLLGVGYLSRTGYNPWGQARFLESLGAEHELAQKLAGEEGRGLYELDFFSTHPRTSERVARAIEAAAGSGAQRDAPFRRDAYLAAIDGLLYGDDPAQGLVRGRVFAHPTLGFTFTVPPQFRITNQAQAVVAQGPRGAVIRFDGDERGGARGMAYYLTRVWRPELELSAVDTLDINGMETATGAARVSGPAGEIDLRLVAIRFSARQIYRFQFTTPPDLTRALARELKRTAFSFRRLERAEAARLKPLRIRMVRVEAGDSAPVLARRMAFDDSALARFEVLNGLAPGQPLAQGSLMKIVVEE
ncbi:MAG: M48 family metalloprotease [Alphaproteobacteria bacterium]